MQWHLSCLTVFCFSQSVINSQNLWDEMLLNKGLTGTGALCCPHPDFVPKHRGHLAEFNSCVSKLPSSSPGMGMSQPLAPLTLPFDKCRHLLVIDVYQAWCGPCKAVQALFRKLKNELNEDEILHFAVVSFSFHSTCLLLQ